MPVVRDTVREVVRNITSNPTDGRFEPSADVKISGGRVKDGEEFSIFYAPGGLTGRTGVTINSIACTSETVIDDFNMTAVAPVDDLVHATFYSVRIF